MIWPSGDDLCPWTALTPRDCANRLSRSLQLPLTSTGNTVAGYTIGSRFWAGSMRGMLYTHELSGRLRSSDGGTDIVIRFGARLPQALLLAVCALLALDTGLPLLVAVARSGDLDTSSSALLFFVLLLAIVAIGISASRRRLPADPSHPVVTFLIELLEADFEVKAVSSDR